MLGSRLVRTPLSVLLWAIVAGCSVGDDGGGGSEGNGDAGRGGRDFGQGEADAGFDLDLSCEGDACTGEIVNLLLFHARESAADTDATGFAPSVARELYGTRARVYHRGTEVPELTLTFDGPRASVELELPPGRGYQVVLEAIDFGDTILSEGASSVFDALPGSTPREIRVFVSRPRQVEYASSLFNSSSGVVSLPSEFEGPEVAVELGLPRSALGGQRAGHTATELPDGRVMVIGGARLTTAGGIAGTPFASFVGTIEIYEPATGYWSLLRDADADPIETPSGGTARPPMRLSVARAFHTATLMADGRVLVAGGFADNLGSIEPSSAVEVIDWREGTIEVLTPGAQDLAEPRAMHTAHWVNDRVVLVGGVTGTFTSPGFTAGIEAYRPEDGYLDRLPDPDGGATLTLAVGRGMHTGTTLGNDGILVTGGRTSGGGVTDTIEYLEVLDGQLRRFYQGSLPTMRVARFGHSAVLMGPDYGSPAARPPEYLAVAGGFTAVHRAGDAGGTLLSGAAPTGSVEFFDTWDLALNGSIEREMATPRAHFGLVETSVTQDLMAFGGLTVGGGGDIVVTPRVERAYRTENGGFPLQVQAFGDDLTLGRAYSGAVAIETHNVLVVGGWDGQAQTGGCGEGGAYLAGCTSEVANPGDLYFLGYLY